MARDWHPLQPPERVSVMFKELLANVPDALNEVEAILRMALESGQHKPFDWRKLDFEGNLSRLKAHNRDLRKARVGKRPRIGDDHLANLACRALFLLQLRSESEGEKPHETHETK